jgi:hypothetical protein
MSKLMHESIPFEFRDSHFGFKSKSYLGSKNPNVKLFFTPINSDCKK